MKTNETIENHPYLKKTILPILTLPGVSSLMRMIVRNAIQQWPLSLRSRQRLNNFFAQALSPQEPIQCVVEVPSGRNLHLHLDLKDDLSRIWYFWGYTGYEAGLVNLLVNLLQTRKTVIEAGANIGYYTLLMASLLEDTGEVHAFEPWPQIARYLQQNAQRNYLHNLVLNQTALTNKDGIEQLYIPANEAWTNASLVKGFTIQEEVISVPVARLDTYCQERQITSVDLVKIDVEGAELGVLQGMGRLWDEQTPDIICEVLPSYEAEINKFFEGRPYRKFLILEEGLKEVDTLSAHPRYRDYYLSCDPIQIHGLEI